MKPAQIAVLIIFLGILIAANYYVFYRIWRMMPPSTIAKVSVIVCGTILVSSFFLAMLARSGGLPAGLLTVLYRIGTSWLFIFLYLLIAFLLADLLRITHLLPMEKVMYSNWAALGVLTATIVVIFAFGNIRYHNKKRVELTLETSRPLDRPVKAIAISDLHLGYGIGRREFSRWVDMLNDEKPDIILIAGDLIDSSPRPLWKRGFAAEIRRLEAKYGVWLNPGNHEYISGIGESLHFFEEAGINVLRDSVALIDGSFYIVGRGDRTNPHRKGIEELTEGLAPDLPVILLDHQPYHLEEAEKAGVDFQLSGHTHRGQVWPVTWVTDALYECSYGYLQKGGTHYWVSSGLGIWGGKFRIGSRSEYVVVNFVPKAE